MRALLVAVLVLVVVACSGGGSSTPPPRLGDVAPTNAVYDPAVAGGTCPGGTDACGTSGFCCPTGTACLANPTDAYGCGSEYCCLGCTAGTACGAGCCAAGTSCVGNPGGATGCAGGLCCSPTAEAECPAGIAAECAAGTRCLVNHSARYCPSGFACYLPGGAVGCPGETMCPNAVDFCPDGTYCGTISGVCPVGSSSGNYCCKTYAQQGDSCDATLCAPGLSCVDNPHCANSAPGALKTCKAPCGGDFPNDCGNYCCPFGFGICSSSPDPCMCYGNI